MISEIKANSAAWYQFRSELPCDYPSVFKHKEINYRDILSCLNFISCVDWKKKEFCNGDWNRNWILARSDNNICCWLCVFPMFFFLTVKGYYLIKLVSGPKYHYISSIFLESYSIIMWYIYITFGLPVLSFCMVKKVYRLCLL